MVKMPVNQHLRLGFLASHGGSGMRAILAAIRAGTLAAEARLAISNNADAPALQAARAEGLATRHISAATAGDAVAADRAIAEAMAAAGVNLIVLSGYLRRLGPVTLGRFRNRILNIHPSLLPRHGGQGLYGRHVHEAVLASGDRTTGASIHLVDGDYDTGPVIAQREVPVQPGDSMADIEARVRAAEPGLYVETLQRIACGDIALPDPMA